MNRILVPVDFSPCSMTAFDHACHFADIFGAEIHLIHTYLVPVLGTSKDGEEEIRKTSMILAENKTAEMEKFVHDYEKLKISRGIHGLDLVIDTIEGPVIDGIIEYSNEIRADLIIMGSTGENRKKDGHIGSTASALINKDRTPVLIVPEKAAFSRPKKLLYAIDYKDFDYDQLYFVINIAQGFEAELTVLHVSSHSPSMKEFEERMFKANREKLMDYEEISFRNIQGSQVREAILNYCQMHHIGLIAMTKRKKGDANAKEFYRSLTNEMSIKLEHPLLILPEPKD